MTLRWAITHPNPEPIPPWRAKPQPGFTLVELLVAAGIGSLICAALMQLLMGDLRITTAMAQRLQLRRQQRQALQLIRSERDLGHGVIANPQPSDSWPCPLAGRDPVLAIALSPSDPGAHSQAIIYSVGPAPSGIWRGQVLMRCGPAYGLDGRMDPSSHFQNRVLLDGLPEGPDQGLKASPDPDLPVIDLSLEQELPGSSLGSRAKPTLVRSTTTL